MNSKEPKTLPCGNPSYIAPLKHRHGMLHSNIKNTRFITKIQRKTSKGYLNRYNSITDDFTFKIESVLAIIKRPKICVRYFSEQNNFQQYSQLIKRNVILL